MAESSNAFDLLTDCKKEDLSLLIVDHLKATMKKSKSKSPKLTEKTLSPSKSIVNAQAPQPKPVKQANFSRGSEDLQNKFVLERSFFRKFGMSEDREFEKPEIGRGLRSESRGGPTEVTGSSTASFAIPVENTSMKKLRIIR